MDKVNYTEEAEGWILAYKSRLHDEKDYSADAAYKVAKLYIEFAQAEQLQRIAKALENIGEAQAASAFGYFPNDDDGREAIQPGDYHYFHKGAPDPEF